MTPPRMGWLRRAVWAGLAFSSLARADIYYISVAGLGGEPDYEQRFTALAADLDRIAKGSGSTSHVVTLSRSAGHS